MENERYICPVCGYSQLEEAPFVRIENNKRNYSYDEGSPTFVICPCCGTEFGYTDDELSWKTLREKWIKNGANWFRTNKKPKGWNLDKQLSNLTKIEKEMNLNQTYKTIMNQKKAAR